MRLINNNTILLFIEPPKARSNSKDACCRELDRRKFVRILNGCLAAKENRMQNIMFTSAAVDKVFKQRVHKLCLGLSNRDFRLNNPDARHFLSPQWRTSF